MTKSGPGWTWHFHTEDQPLASGTVDVPAGGKSNFRPSGFGRFDRGTYRLIISDDASGAATSVRFNIGWNTAAGAGRPRISVCALPVPDTGAIAVIERSFFRRMRFIYRPASSAGMSSA